MILGFLSFSEMVAFILFFLSFSKKKKKSIDCKAAIGIFGYGSQIPQL